MNYLRISGVSKEYRVRRGFRVQKIPALNGIEITLHQGEIAAILGRNGAGKTTLMNILAGILFPTRGIITIEGRSPLDYRGAIGYLPEFIYLPEFLTPRDFLNIMGSLSGMEPAARLSERISWLLSEFELSREQHNRIGTLSMGKKRRLLIAHSFLNLPRLLLLDEPTVYLDLLGKEKFYSLLLGMKEKGCTVVIASHLLSDIERLGDRIFVFKEGMISHTFSRQELAAQPDTERFIVGLLKDEKN